VAASEAGEVTAVDLADAPGAAGEDGFEDIQAPDLKKAAEPKAAKTKTKTTAEDDNLEELEEPKPKPKAKAQPKAEEPKLRVKGKELPLSAALAELQALPPEELQKILAADVNFREAAAMREAARKEREAVKREKEEAARLAKQLEDPEQLKSLLTTKLGADFDKLVEERFAKKLERDLMDPKDREVLEAKERLAELEARLKTEEESKVKAKEAEQDRILAEQTEKELIPIADMIGLPGTPDAIETLVDVALEFVDAGINYTPDMLAREVKDRFQNSDTSRAMQLLTSLDEDKLLAWNPDLTKKFRSALIADQKRRRAAAGAPAAVEKPAVRAPAEEALTGELTQAKLNKILRDAGLI